jgi:cell volume regulation protein A
MSLIEFQVALAIGCALLLLSVLAVKATARVGIPVLLGYMAIGVAVGEAGLGVRFDDFELTQNIGLAALALILAEGGLTTRWSDVRPILGFTIVLSTVGVAVSVAVVAAGAHFLVGVDVRTALLLGAIVSSTDAAAVFSVLRDVPLRGRVRPALEAESGFNDAPVVILVSLIVSDGWETVDPLTAVGLVALQLVAGAGIGVAVGATGQVLLARAALPSAALYPVAVMSMAVLAFAAAGALQVSGFVACYVAALWLGNVQLPHGPATRMFAESAAWLAQISLFVLLGLLASPARLPEAVVPALVVGAVLLVVARPLSVVVTATPFRFTWREQAFLSCAGLRGAVPIVLTTVAAAGGYPDATLLFDIVFLLVIVFTLVQAPTLPTLARRLGLAGDAVPPRAVTVTPVPGSDDVVIDVTVDLRSRLAGRSVGDLKLPRECSVVLVVRDGEPIPADRTMRLLEGDRLEVVTRPAAQQMVEDRLSRLSRLSRPSTRRRRD